MKPTEERPVGMPKQLKDGRAVNVYLDKESIELARKFGEGSISAGIRKALLKLIFHPKV